MSAATQSPKRFRHAPPPVRCDPRRRFCLRTAFLLVGKQATNLSNNAKIIGQFGNLSGSVVNIALFVKSQISSGKSIEFLTLPDGKGGFFQTTRIGLVLSSVCYAVKYVGRGVKIMPEGLPIGQDPRLLAAYVRYTSPSNGSPGMSPFMALILMIGELVDEFSQGEKPSEYAVLFTQINAATGAEGTIGGTAGYSGPYLMKYLLYILYSLYLLLLLTTDLVPNNEWNSIWISMVLAFTTICFFQISERYGNPMKLRSKRMGQKPLVSEACVGAEVCTAPPAQPDPSSNTDARRIVFRLQIAVTSVFSRAASSLIGAVEGGAVSTGAAFGHPGHGLKFTIG